MNISLYTSLYLVNQNKFNFEDALTNFSRFASEVIVSTCPAGFVDDSLDTIKTFLVKEKLDNVKIVVDKDINFNNPLFDGWLKNSALQHCSNEIVIGIDADEFIPLGQKPLWEEYAEFLLNRPDLDGLSIHNVDLFNDLFHYKSIGQKPYLHKKTGVKRGVVNYARKENGHIDITKSDTCDWIHEDGSLANIMWGPSVDADQIKHFGYPFVAHTGWISKEYRSNINKWWSVHWNNRAGYEVNDIITKQEDLEKIEVFEHNLNLN